MNGRVQLGWAIALLSGCGGPDLLFLELPETSDRSAVAIVSDGADPRIFGIDLVEERRLVLEEWTFANQLSVELHLYPTSLRQLGLDAGEMEVVGEGQSPRKLPAPASVFRATNESPTFVASEASAETQRIRIIAMTSPCREFDATSYVLTSSATGFRIAPYDDTAALGMLISTPGVMLLKETGPEPLEFATPHRLNAMFRGDDGAYWIGGEDGELWRAEVLGGRFESTLVDQIPGDPPLIPNWRFMDGGLIDGKMELAMIARFGRVSRYFDGTLVDYPHFTAASKGNALWLGPGQAMFASGDEARLMFVSGDDVTYRSIPAFSESIHGFEDLGELGVYIMSGPGLVHRYLPDGSIDRLENTTIALNNYTVVKDGDRLLYGGALGLLAEYIPGFGFCEPIKITRHAIRRIVPLGSGSMILETVRSREVDEARYFVITPKP